MASVKICMSPDRVPNMLLSFSTVIRLFISYTWVTAQCSSVSFLVGCWGTAQGGRLFI
jgi:hypothetical protein